MEMFEKIIIVTTVCLLVLVWGLYFYYDTEEEFVSYGDNVRVSKSIAEGYEDSDYIPRSVSINKNLKQDGNR